ncbi:MAG: hypothetical protein AAF682_02955 [Planctomycetota bacterium]
MNVKSWIGGAAAALLATTALALWLAERERQTQPLSPESAARTGGVNREGSRWLLADVLAGRGRTEAPPAASSAATPARLLQVTDLDGRPLTGVRLVRERSSLFGAHPGPVGARDVLLEDAASPLTLPGDAVEDERVWVGAEGYEWRRLPERGDAVALGPAAELEVAVHGVPAGSRLAVQVLADEHAPVELLARERTLFLLDGLSPGPREVKLAPPGWSQAVPVDRAEAELERGRRTVVELQYPADAARDARIALEGEIRLPAELTEAPALWEELFLLVYRVDAEGRREPRAATSAGFGRGAGAYALAQSFRTKPLPRGDYELVLHPLGAVWPVHLADDTPELSLVAEPLARTLVHAVESTSFTRPRSLQVSVACDLARGAFASAWQRATPEGDAYEVFSAPGRLRLFVNDPRFGLHVHEVEVHPGWNQKTLELERSFPFSLELAGADGAPLTAPDDWWLGIEVLPDDAAHRVLGVDLVRLSGMTARDIRRARVSVSSPGSYRLALPPLDGLALPDSIAVRVGDGAQTRVTVTADA